MFTNKVGHLYLKNIVFCAMHDSIQTLEQSFLFLLTTNDVATVAAYF